MMRRLLTTFLAAAMAVSAGAQTQMGSPLARAVASHPQPGDRIAVHVVGEPFASDTVSVTNRGEAPFARLGVLKVTDLSVSALQDTLYVLYSRILKTPAIEVSVLRRIGIEGQVMRPSVYFVDVATTLRELIARAGGTTEVANRNSVWIMRDGQRIPVPNWQRDQSITSDLHSGDQVVVGRKSWLELNLIGAIGAVGVLTSIVLALSR